MCIMRKVIILFLIILSNAGCTTIPFRKVNYVVLDNVDPQLVRQEFILVLPKRAQVLNSIVFQYRWHSFFAIGYMDINLDEQTFALSCLSPAGIKLFELSGDRNTIRSKFILKELLQRGDLPRAVGEDIRRIYFDLVPSKEARVVKEKYRIIFREPKGPGIMEYVFAGPQRRLIEKRYSEKKRRVWGVFYYEFQAKNGQLYPARIMLKHYRFGYNLIVHLREVY